MRQSKRIEPDMICIYDAKNESKQDLSGVLNVRVLKLAKKRKLFRSFNIWQVVSIGGLDPQPFECEESKLIPSENMVCVVRNPIDMPVFNQHELDSIDQAMILLTNDFKLRNENNKLYIDTMYRLNALKSKIKFSMSMRDI